MLNNTSTSHPGGSKRITNAGERADNTEKESGQADVGDAEGAALEKAGETERGSGGDQG